MARIEELKAENIGIIRKCLYQRKRPWTRPELSEQTGLSMAGIANVLKTLLERREIRYEGDAPSTGGRKSKQYGLSPDFAHIGMMFLTHGGGKSMALVSSLDLGGDKVWQKHFEYDFIGAKELLAILRELFRTDPHVSILIVSVPGIVASDGSLLDNDLPALSGVALKQILEETFSVPVQVENDVNLAVIGYGKTHPECRDLAILYQPDEDGAGIGLLIDRKLYRGCHGFAGELGRFETAQQLAALHKDPLHVLQMQVGLLTCMAAPERIGWCCPLIQEDVSYPEGMRIPEKARPVLEHLDNLEVLSRVGAEQLGRMGLLEALAP